MTKDEFLQTMTESQTGVYVWKLSGVGGVAWVDDGDQDPSKLLWWTY